MNRSNIEWTEKTWNPTTGCDKISSGCKNCYAERWANMQQKRGINQYKNGFEVTLAENRLNEPYKWKKAQLIFVNSMSDLFHEKISDEYIMKVFEVMNNLPIHNFQILTKRIERAARIATQLIWSKNIWLGVSVENAEFQNRITLLKKMPALIKFISYEPLIGPIKSIDYSGISWVLVGGESGSSARKIEKSWVLSIKDVCKEQNIPFFFKQWGKREFNPDNFDPTLNKTHNLYSKGGCMIDKELYREYPNN